MGGSVGFDESAAPLWEAGMASTCWVRAAASPWEAARVRRVRSATLGGSHGKHEVEEHEGWQRHWHAARSLLGIGGGGGGRALLADAVRGDLEHEAGDKSEHLHREGPCAEPAHAQRLGLRLRLELWSRLGSEVEVGLGEGACAAQLLGLELG